MFITEMISFFFKKKGLPEYGEEGQDAKEVYQVYIVSVDVNAIVNVEEGSAFVFGVGGWGRVFGRVTGWLL